MMRTLLFSLFFLTAIAVQAGGGGKWKGKYTKEKTINKEFSVNATALMKVRNSYGNLTLTSWNENRVVIEVRIKTNGNNEEKVKKRLEEITVDFQNSSDMVSARTRFGDKNRWGWGGNNNRVNVQVDYIIKLPIKNSVDLSNDYGSIFLDRVDGHAKISCDYGKLEIGELRGRNNELHFDYTSRSTFDYINSATIYADYSGFTVTEAKSLSLRADYTKSVIDNIGNLEYSNDYGSVEVGRIDNLSGNGDYVGVKLREVHGNVDLSADYGSIKIGEMAADAGNLNIKTEYTGIKVGYAPGYNFDFEIVTEYAGVSGKDDFEINISKEKSSERYYKGHRGKPNSGNKVYINSEYGGVTFYKN